MRGSRIFGKNSEPIPTSGTNYHQFKKYIDYKINKVLGDFRKELEDKKDLRIKAIQKEIEQ